MKKLLLVLIFLVTGCFGEVGRGYLTVTCTKEEQFSKQSKNTTIKIKYKDNKVVNLDINEIYKGEINEIKEAINSQKEIFKDSKGIDIKTKEDKDIYYVNYSITKDKLKEEDLKRLKIKDEYYNQQKQYENDGFECRR